MTNTVTYLTLSPQQKAMAYNATCLQSFCLLAGIQCPPQGTEAHRQLERLYRRAYVEAFMNLPAHALAAGNARRSA